MTTALLAGFTVLAPTIRGADWMQSPDLNAGLNVKATAPVILADDFLSTFTGPITNITIWGSWLNDDVDPWAQFRLSIHTNIPGLHVPGPEILGWTLFSTPKPFAFTDKVERLYDPETGLYANSVGPPRIWQYDFFIPMDQAFEQEFGNTYWLNVQALISPASPGAVFGWKTTDQPWMDKAVWWPDTMPPESADVLPWDMAFAINTVPEPTGLLLVGLGWGLLVWFRRRSLPG
jgi:hypothetical protein